MSFRSFWVGLGDGHNFVLFRRHIFNLEHGWGVIRSEVNHPHHLLHRGVPSLLRVKRSFALDLGARVRSVQAFGPGALDAPPGAFSLGVVDGGGSLLKKNTTSISQIANTKEYK